MRRNWKITAVAAIAGLLCGGLLSGCGDGEENGSEASPSTTSHPAESSTPASPTGTRSGSPTGTGPSVPASVRNSQQAMDTAEDAVSGTKAYAIEHDDDGQQDWEVKLAARDGGNFEAKQYVVQVSDDGSKVNGKREQSDRDDDAPKLKDTQVSLREAVQRAADDRPGEELTAAEIDRPPRFSKDRPEVDAVWEVHTENPASPGANGDDAAEHETVIDAGTGAQLAARRD